MAARPPNRPRGRVTFTAAEVAAAKKLASLGACAWEIATTLGLTEYSTRKIIKEHGIRVRNGSRRGGDHRRPSVAVNTQLKRRGRRPHAADVAGVSILELSPSMCRAPMWEDGESYINAADWRYCGAPVVDGSSYCAHHRERFVDMETTRLVQARARRADDHKKGGG